MIWRKRDLTKFFILYQITTEKPNRLIDIASKLDMTEQGVSNYIKEMRKEGLIETDKKYSLSYEGIKLIRDVIKEMNEFLDQASKKIDFISSCIAIADENIEKGEEVKLYMKKGLLYASVSKSNSQGISSSSVKKGYPVEIKDLKGITEMELGKVIIYKISSKKDIEKESSKLKKTLKEKKYDKIAILGELGYGVLNILEKDPDIIFSPISSTINAAQKGLDVFLLVKKEEVSKVTKYIEKENKSLNKKYQINYEIIN